MRPNPGQMDHFERSADLFCVPIQNWIDLPGASRALEIFRPEVGFAGAADDLSVRRRGVDHFSVSDIDPNMTDRLAAGAEKKQVSDLQIVHRLDLLPIRDL